MSWGTRKRNFIIFIFVSIVLIILGTVSFLYFYEEPNCFDTKQNGDETGIDCGGSCQLLCSEDTLDPIVHWVRYFKIADGLYSAMAYVENKNLNATVKNLPYKFKIYDEKGVILVEKNGRIDLKPRHLIPISETGLFTGEAKPVRITFDFTDEIVWQKTEREEPAFVIKDEEIFFDGEVQKVTAEAINSAFESIQNVTFVVIVYDKNNNAIASSATFLKEIMSNQSVNLLFTWPTSFQDDISRFEIIPLY